MKKRAFLTLAAVLLVALAGVGYCQRAAFLAWHYAEQLRSSEADARTSFVSKFEGLGAPGATAIIRLLSTADEMACQNAGYVLGELLGRWGHGDQRCQVVVSSLAESGRKFSPAGMKEALHLLRMLVEQETEPTAGQMAAAARLLQQAGSTAETRLAALQLAAELMRHSSTAREAMLSQARAWVVAGIKDEQAAVRAAAIRLAVAPGVQAYEVVGGVLAAQPPDPSAEVRQLAILALGGQEALLSTDELCRWLQDEDEGVYKACESALRARGLTREQVELAELAYDRRPSRRAEAPAMVLSLPELDAYVWFERLCRDPSPAVRAAAARAIGSQPDRRLQPLIVQLAEQDQDATVQSLARYFLMQSMKEVRR